MTTIEIAKFMFVFFLGYLGFMGVFWLNYKYQLNYTAEGKLFFYGCLITVVVVVNWISFKLG